MVRAGDSLPGNARVVPLAETRLDGSGGYLDPQHHVSTWLVSRRDAVSPYLFAKPYQHPIRRIRDAYIPNEYWFDEEPGKRPPIDFERLARDWDYVWIIGADPVEEELRRHGSLHTLYGELRIYRLRK